MTVVANFGKEFYQLFDGPDACANDAAREFIRWHFREDLGCLLVNCAVDPHEVHSSLCEVIGGQVSCQSGTSSITGMGRLLWLTPRSWLLQCRFSDEDELAARINGNFLDKRVHAAQTGDGLCWFELAGAEAQALIAEGGFLSLDAEGLRVGCVKRVLFASVSTIFIRESEDTWQLGVERSRARYVTDWIRSAVLRATALSSNLATR